MNVVRAWWSGVLLAALLPAASAHAQAGVIVTTGLAMDHEAGRGDVVRGSIELHNLGTTAWTGTIRLADYATQAQQPLFETSGSRPRSIGPWMSVDPSTITLDAGERGLLNYEVRVPDDPTLIGSYWGAVLIRNLDVETVAEAPAVGFALQQVSQTAVRVNVEVATGAEAMLLFDAINLEPEDAGNVLYIDMSNPGQRWGRVTPRIELFAPDGARLEPLVAEPRSLYPGSSWRYVIPLGTVTPGDYAMLVVADGGTLGVFATRRALHVP